MEYTNPVIFGPFRSQSIRKSAYVNSCLFSIALIISRLDLESQSKFQMFTLYSGRHIGVPGMYTNVLGSVNFWETFTTNI